jgi:hypothetical protein
MSVGEVSGVNIIFGVKQSRRKTILVLLDPEYNGIANLRNSENITKSTRRKIVESLNLNLFLPQFALCVCLCERVLSFLHFDMDMSYTRVLYPTVVHSHSHSQMTSRVLRHTAAAMRAHNVLQGTAAAMRAHNVLQGTVEQLR